MIKANELRIGNWVMVKTSNDAGFYMVSGIDGWMRVFESKEDERIYNLTLDKQIKSKKIAKYHDERLIRIIGGARDKELFIESKLRPIPLTHDILKKTNMVHSFPYGGNNGYYELNGFYLHYDMEEENDFFVMYERKLIKINSLHQLQNLYFCLCGEEIEIKL